MVDLYLQAKLKPERSSPKKSAWDSQLNAEIDKSLAKEEQGDQEKPDPFNTPEMKKAKLKAQINETLQFKELSNYIETAINILARDGKNHLSNDQFYTLAATFSHAEQYLAKPAPNLDNYQAILHITNAEMEAITKVALDKFDEDQFSDCLAIFILLTTLRPDIADYWNRAGIAAQKAGLPDLAIKFYNASLEIDPEYISSHLFLIDYYITLKKFQNAQIQYDKAKPVFENKEMDEASIALFAKLKILINANAERS